MTTQTVLIDAYDYGVLTLGAKLRDPDDVSLEDTATSVTKSGSLPSRITAVFTVVVSPAGVYLLELIVGTVSYSLYVKLTGVDGEVAVARSERPAELDPAVQAQITAIEDGVDANTGYLTAIVAKFSGITVLADWFRRVFRKDVGTAGMIVAESEISTGGTSTFTGTTDNLEALSDSISSSTESDLMVSTTIATLTSQTVFTLTAGSADNDAYNGQLVVITDSATSTQKARVIVSDYVGSTKTITLTGAPAFTIAVGDSISIIAIGSSLSSADIAGAVSSAVVSAGIAATVTGMPTFLRVGDARTVANGSAIPVRLYDADDGTLLFGLGDNLFADATITFSLRRAGNDSAEGTEDAVIPCTWVESGADGYVQIAYEGDALDDCEAMDRVKEKDCHRYGIKFQWGDDDPITPVFGNIFVLRKIVTTQSS